MKPMRAMRFLLAIGVCWLACLGVRADTTVYRYNWCGDPADPVLTTGAGYNTTGCMVSAFDNDYTACWGCYEFYGEQAEATVFLANLWKNSQSMPGCVAI